jgi:hypothetical protein
LEGMEDSVGVGFHHCKIQVGGYRNYYFKIYTF